MIETELEERVERLFAGVTTGAVSAVVAEGDRFGEGDVQSEGSRDAGGDLGDLEGVGEARAHVVVGDDEHLGLARQPAKGRGVQDTVAITFKTRAELIRLFFASAVAST